VACLDAIRVALHWNSGAQVHYVCLLIVEPYARNAPEGLDGALGVQRARRFVLSELGGWSGSHGCAGCGIV
jgi:hypothetical protein